MSKFDPDNPLTNELKKSLETTKGITDSIQPILNEQARLAELTRPLGEIAAINSGITSAMKIKSSAVDALKSANLALEAAQYTSPMIDMPKSIIEPVGLAAIKMSTFHIDTSLYKIAGSISQALSNAVTASIQGVLNNFSSALITAIESPFVKWLSSVDFSPLTRIWEGWDFAPSLSERYDELNEIYLRAMYDAKWFPYAGWIADIELFAEVNDILNTSRGMSKRCEKRIDKAILSYYVKAEIKRIKKQWKVADLEPHIKKALGQVLEAYLRKEYALVIPFLATMWEGIIKSKTEENTKKPKEDFKKLVDGNGYDEVFSDFYNNMIIGTCYGIEDVVEGIPNRHGIAHSWYIKYPSQKAALNAILLTDFLINLKPKKKDEKKSDIKYENKFSSNTQEDVDNG